MPTIRLIPSSYASSSSSYATVYSGEANMYNNTDHTSNYASLRGRNNSTTTAYYIFIKGFNFDDVPHGAIVSSFEVKIRCYKNSYQRTGDNYRLRLASSPSINNVISNSITSTEIGTTASVIAIPTGNISWSTLSGYGDDFSIVVPLSSTASNRPYIYVYGAEINVTYSMGTPRTVTTSLTGNGTIDPSGTETYYDGETYNLTVTPDNASDTVSATKNGSAITLTKHTGGEEDTSTVLGAYKLVSGGFNGSGASYFQGLVGKGHTSTQTTSNYYSSGNGTIAVFTYDVPFTDIPKNATIKSLYMMVNGHAESTSQSSEYMCARLISGSTNLSDELNFKSIGTSNSTQTVTANVTPTIAQLENLQVQCRLGYYGGAINGATVYLEYETPDAWYTYSTTISGDMTVAVTIGGGGGTPELYVKTGGGDDTYIGMLAGSDLGYPGSLYYSTYSWDMSSVSDGDYCHIVCRVMHKSYSGVTVYSYIDIDEIFEFEYGVGKVFTVNGVSFTFTFNSTYLSISCSDSAQGSDTIGFHDYGSSSGTGQLYKTSGSGGQWTKVLTAYKKVNGTWVVQSDVTTVFQSGVNYKKGN